MKFGIIRFPESTGHNDMAYVLRENSGTAGC
jgi:hypothetical protein